MPRHRIDTALAAFPTAAMVALVPAVPAMRFSG
jgi:hypothetical protein